jgi:hypothetical protein
MSFIHSTIVGHFDPELLHEANVHTLRPIDEESARGLLAEFPREAAQHITFHDGYVECSWAGSCSVALGRRIHEFAYKLAERENCIAAESPVFYITYPEEAKQIQAEAWRKWREENPPLNEGETSPFPSIQLESAPCPYCGQPLRTSLARQCRFCKMDWHDPQNVFRRS